MIATTTQAIRERLDARLGAPGGERMRARLRRYAIWQLRDFIRERGVWLLAFGLVALAVFRVFYEPLRFNPDNVPQGELFKQLSEAAHFRAQLAQLSGVFAFIGTLIATHGIVSRDRERGHQRLLFAKPVSITGYYLQAFLVNGIGFVATGTLLLAVAALLFGHMVPALAIVTYGALQYLLLGGLVFLLSTLIRHDFAVATVLALAAFPVNAMAWRAHGTTELKALALLLPPMPSLAEALQHVHLYSPLGGALVAPICYGIVYVGCALIVLRRRSISA